MELAWMDFRGRAMTLLGPSASLKGLSWAINSSVLRTLAQVPFTLTVLILNQEKNNLICTTTEAILLFTAPQKWAVFLPQHCLYFLRLLSAKQDSYLEQ